MRQGKEATRGEDVVEDRRAIYEVDDATHLTGMCTYCIFCRRGAARGGTPGDDRRLPTATPHPTPLQRRLLPQLLYPAGPEHINFMVQCLQAAASLVLLNTIQ